VAEYRLRTCLVGALMMPCAVGDVMAMLEMMVVMDDEDR
jgi:hypothetical protein